MRTFPPVAIAARRQSVVVERALPFAGEVMVGHGRRVQPGTVVARGEEPGQPFGWFVPDLVSTDGKESSVRLTKQVGDSLTRGECLAVRKGFLGREKAFCPSPVDGSLSAVDLARGHVVITPSARPVELTAGVEGTVVEVNAGRGVLVLVPALYGQGVSLVGNETWGQLVVGSSSADGGLTAQTVLDDAVVVAGVLDEASVESALKGKAKALVVGSAPLATWRALVEGRWPGLTVMLVDGIGRGGMNPGTFDGLKSANGAIALVTQARSVFGALGRPEIVVSLPGTTLPELDLPRLEPGSAVRVVSGVKTGAVGVVSSLPLMPARRGAGRPGNLAFLTLADGTPISAPVCDLELLG